MEIANVDLLNEVLIIGQDRGSTPFNNQTGPIPKLIYSNFNSTL